MEKLKELLEKKKAEGAQQKRVKLGDVQKQQYEEYLKEKEAKEKEKEEKLKRKIEEQDEYYRELEKKKKKIEPNVPEVNLIATTSTEEAEKEPPIPKADIIKRLRTLKEPVTLFGETDWLRYERLRVLETENADDIKIDGSENIFQKDLELNDDDFRKLTGTEEKELTMEAIDKHLESRMKVVDFSAPEFKGRKKASLSEGISREEKCQDIYYFCQKQLKEWEKDLEGKFEEINESEEAKNAVGQYRQCCRNIKPLFIILKEEVKVNDEILDALYHIAHYCLLREYVKAHDKYLEISIGNAPWPMGVTMVGIHERSGRSKIFTSQIAHILNDETQRKYLQAIKRLMTIAQKKNPADYSRNVNM